MKTTEIVGFRRSATGKKDSKALRADGNVPCVIYGGEEVIHFHTPAYILKELLYTPDAYIAELNIEGTQKRAVLKDAQFHPVSEFPLHVDFLEIFEDKPVEVLVPIKTVGTSPGVALGGQLQVKNRQLRVKAVPASLPEYVEVNISELELGKSVKVKELTIEGYEILNNPQVSIASVVIPRALKAGGLEEGEEGEEATEEAAAE